MYLIIVIISIVLIALAGIALSSKYYKNKRAPVCLRDIDPDNYDTIEKCDLCGTDNVEDCKRSL